MPCEGQTFLIQEYFSDFRKKLKGLDELFKGAFEEEVLIRHFGFRAREAGSMLP
jgi:hypothetical protein